MKSVPDDDLLKMLAADLDPAHVKQLDQMILWTQELQECMIMQYLLLMPFESTKRLQNSQVQCFFFIRGRGQSDLQVKPQKRTQTAAATSTILLPARR